MKEEQKILLKLLAAALKGEKLQGDDLLECDFEPIMTEALAQAVPLLALDAFPDGIVPKKSESLEKAATFAAKNLNLRQVQKSFVKLLNENGVNYVILKGEAAADCYPDPSLRLLGDIDVLIAESDLEKVGKLLESKGFERGESESEKHIVYRSKSIRIELHFEIPGMPEGDTKGAIKEYMQGVIENAVTAKGGFRMPRDDYQAVILLLHAKHHILYEGIGLRHLCDLACFFDKTENAPFYSEKLLPLLEKTGLLTFAKITAKTCAVYLGSKLPDFAKDADDAVCREFIEDILAGGNFGEKDEGRIRSGSVMKEGKGGGAFRAMFKTLGENVRARANGRKILYPFLYIGLSVKYLCLVICGKRPAPQKTASDINKRAELYKKMQIM